MFLSNEHHTENSEKNNLTSKSKSKFIYYEFNRTLQECPQSKRGRR